jgi:hypothetical protein
MGTGDSFLEKFFRIFLYPTGLWIERVHFLIGFGDYLPFIVD